MTLEQIRASLREKHGALAALKAKAFATEGTDDDLKAYKDAITAAEKDEEKISLLEREEALDKKAHAIAPAPAAPVPAVQKLPAEVRKVEPGQAYSLAAASMIKAKDTGEHPLKILEGEGYGGLAQILGSVPHNRKAVNTLESSEGGLLVPTAQVGGNLMELLRYQSTFLAANPVRVPMINGQYKLGRGLAGATASYVAEGALKPVSTPTFDSITMASKKLAGIVPITREARMWTVGDIDAYVRGDLQMSLGTTLDLNAYLGTGAGASPTGILNKVGVSTVTAATYITGTITDPTLPEIDALVNAMILSLTSNKLYANQRWRWVMSYRTALKFAAMRVGDSDGDLAFPGLAPLNDGGTFKGFPVIVSSQIPTNGGGTTDETTLALVDFSQVLFGEEEGITMRVSEEATLDLDGAGDLYHLWQQNTYAILAEMMHDFGLRTVKAVVKSTIRF
jgi:HK97 family phage major capsid protein